MIGLVGVIRGATAVGKRPLVSGRLPDADEARRVLPGCLEWAGAREEGVARLEIWSAWFESGWSVTTLAHTQDKQPPVPFSFSFSFLLSAFPVRGGTGTAADHKPPAAAACIGMVRGVGSAVNEPIRGCPGLSAAKSAATALDDSVSVTLGGLLTLGLGGLNAFISGPAEKCGQRLERRRVGDGWFIVQKVSRTATPSIGSKCLAGPAAANPARAERAEVSQHHKEAEQGRALGTKV